MHKVMETLTENFSMVQKMQPLVLLKENEYCTNARWRHLRSFHYGVHN